MSIDEQISIKTAYYKDANRYMDNAAETLKKAGKEGKYYQDEKYVRTACGIAYNGVLKAVDGYLLLKGVDKKKGRQSIEYYQAEIARIDKKLNVELKNAYDILHLSGYYDGITNVNVVKEGIETAYTIIDRIKP